MTHSGAHLPAWLRGPGDQGDGTPGCMGNLPPVPPVPPVPTIRNNTAACHLLSMCLLPGRRRQAVWIRTVTDSLGD